MARGKTAPAPKAYTRNISKFLFGAHVAASGGIYNAITNANLIGANSFAMFLRSPRRWDAPPLKESDIEKFKLLCKENNYDPLTQILPHGSYLINLANPDEEKAQKSYITFVDDLNRCEQLGIGLYNFHPGSAIDSEPADALKRLAKRINDGIKETKFVKVVVEIMAGQGNIVCGNIEELGELLKMIDNKERIGFCIDTCHAFASGYELGNENAWLKFWLEFEEKVGWEYLSALHVNDSMAPRGCNRDLHQKLGWGFLGLECFRLMVNDDRMMNIPLILETPVKADEDDSCYGDEIKMMEWLQGKSSEDKEVTDKIIKLQILGASSRKDQEDKMKKRDEKAKAKPKATPKKRKAGNDIMSLMTKKVKEEK